MSKAGGETAVLATIEPTEDCFAVAIALSALFDLRESGRVFRKQGPQAYRDYQQVDTLIQVDGHRLCAIMIQWCLCA